jgi:serine/threonine protein kinase
VNTESSAAQTLCGQCFARQVQDGTCGACGTPVRPMRPKDALPLGTLLNGKFEVGNLLGDRGGFGLVYLGWDRNLRRKVVIKELLPDGLVMRQAGRTEARGRPRQSSRSSSTCSARCSSTKRASWRSSTTCPRWCA